MAIKRYPRVNYEKNPLVEVVCQISFPSFDLLADERLARFQENAKALGYPVFEERKATRYFVGQPPDGKTATEPSPQVEFANLYSFSSEDGEWKVLLSPEFLEVSSSSYSRWEDFKAPLMKTAEVFAEIFPLSSVDKVSLRYKDLIEREALGLAGVPWKELLAPFIVGALAADIFVEESSAARLTRQHNSQSLFALSECEVLLQSALLHSRSTPEQQAFLIDSDFFVESLSMSIDDSNKLAELLDVLHEDAGALFRNCIQGRLHDALCPKSF